MGIPIWQSKESEIKCRESSNSLIRSTLRHSIANRHQQRRRRRTALLTEPYYYLPLDNSHSASHNGDTTTNSNNDIISTAPDTASTRTTTTPTTTTARHPTDASQENPTITTTITASSPPLFSSRTHLPLTTRSQIDIDREIDREIEQRFHHKQELLDQLKITTSLLDQFLSIRDMSGQELALPPFITDDLLAILTATSATLANTTSSSSTSFQLSSSAVLTSSPISLLTSSTPAHAQAPRLISPSSATVSASSNNSPNTNPNFISRRPIDYRSIRSYGNPSSNFSSLGQIVDRLMESPPHASRWAELESHIATAHHRVSDQLNLLGASLSPSLSSTLSHFSHASPSLHQFSSS